MDQVKRPDKPKKDDLTKLYDICNQIFKKKECFYKSEKQIEKEKEKI